MSSGIRIPDPAEGQRLRRCHGCFAGPVYCKTAFQRAHWLEHKLAFHGLGMRRDRDFYRIFVEPVVLRRSYASVEAFSNAVSDFVEAHKWAFTTAAFANRVLSFGTSMDEYPADLCLQFRLLTRGRPSRNPAHGFRWDNMRWKHTDECLIDIHLNWVLDGVLEAPQRARAEADR